MCCTQCTQASSPTIPAISSIPKPPLVVRARYSHGGNIAMLLYYNKWLAWNQCWEIWSNMSRYNILYMYISDFPKDEWRHIKTLPTEELFGPPLFGAPWQCFLSPWLVRWWFGGCGSGWFGAIQPRPWLGVACRLVAKGVGTLGWKFGGKKHAKWPTVVVSILKHLRYAPEIQHHYGFQALAAGVTFAIVFRTQLAWNRQGHIEHMLTVHRAIFDRWEIWSQVLGGGDAVALHVQQVCGCLPTVLRLRGGVENLRIC